MRRNGYSQRMLFFPPAPSSQWSSKAEFQKDQGRKNQIRVTLGNLNHYVLGDDKYGSPENPINRLCLHAYELKFKHPNSKKIFEFKTVLPPEMENLMK